MEVHMPEPVEIVLVTSDQGAAEEAARELSGTPGDEPLVSEKRGLDGGVAQWVVLGAVAAGNLKPFLDVVLRLVQRNKVEIIKAGDIEITNPRPEDVDRLLDARLGQAPGDSGRG
jgi:hypothetical protein